MTTPQQFRVEPQPSAKRTAILGLLALSWFATPVLFFGAAIIGASFFGEAPSDQDVTTSIVLLVAAGVTGFVAPAIATFLALGWDRRPVAWLTAGQLGITIAAVAWLFVKTR